MALMISIIITITSFIIIIVIASMCRQKINKSRELVESKPQVVCTQSIDVLKR